MAEETKAIRVSAEAAAKVDEMAAQREQGKATVATAMVLAGYLAMTRPGEALTGREDEAVVAGLRCSTLTRCADLTYPVPDPTGGPDLSPETLASYADRKGLSLDDALVRLLGVALGREAALRKDRARVKSGRAADRTYGPREPKVKPADRPVVLGPWDAPGEEEGPK